MQYMNKFKTMRLVMIIIILILKKYFYNIIYNNLKILIITFQCII